MLKKKKNYIDKEYFNDLILKYYEDKKIDPDIKIPEEIGKCLILIATNFATKRNFREYSWKEEMIGDGLLRSVIVIKNNKYNPNISTNPHGYFSTVIERMFIQRLVKEKLYASNKNNYTFDIDSLYDCQEHDDNNYNFNNDILCEEHFCAY